MPPPLIPRPSITPGDTGSLELSQALTESGVRPETWIVRTPAGLIIAEAVARNGWRIVFEGAVCRVSVPDYAPLGENYQVCWQDLQGRLCNVSFDVVARNLRIRSLNKCDAAH